MTMVEAIGTRLQEVMEEKNYNYYRIQRDGGVDRSTVSDIAQAKYKSGVDIKETLDLVRRMLFAYRREAF